MTANNSPERKSQLDICIGCGACTNIRECSASMVRNDKGFLRPSWFLNPELVDEQELMNICPLEDRYSISSLPWSEYLGSYYAFAKDELLRKQASSGGIVSALCDFVLKSGSVDAIIQSSVSNDPTVRYPSVSFSSHEVEERSGSWYSPVSMLDGLDELLDCEKRYCFVGKPCEVHALSRLQKCSKKYDNIVVKISFFCGGTPSFRAVETLFKSLGIDDSAGISSLSFRGKGWPGKTTVISHDKRYSMDYSQSWGEILGRDIQKYCRTCCDSVGPHADIVCADGWYIDESGNPDFSEHEGRSLVLTRTDLGESIFHAAAKYDFTSYSKVGNEREIFSMQPYQAVRKAYASDILAGYIVCRQGAPALSLSSLRPLRKTVSFTSHLRYFLGTIKRCLRGRV